jgi:hypothetical protein
MAQSSAQAVRYYYLQCSVPSPLPSPSFSLSLAQYRLYFFCNTFPCSQPPPLSLHIVYYFILHHCLIHRHTPPLSIYLSLSLSLSGLTLDESSLTGEQEPREKCGKALPGKLLESTSSLTTFLSTAELPSTTLKHCLLMQSLVLLLVSFPNTFPLDDLSLCVSC